VCGWSVGTTTGGDGRGGDTYQVAWDNKGNIYAHDAQNGYVRVYNVTSTKMKEAPGSPYSIRHWCWFRNDS
jgi:hypothetical protein